MKNFWDDAGNAIKLNDDFLLLKVLKHCIMLWVVV